MLPCHFLFVSTQCGLQESKKTKTKQLDKTNHIPNLVWLRPNTGGGTSIKMPINDSKTDINDLRPHSTSLPLKSSNMRGRNLSALQHKIHHFVANVHNSS